MRSKLILWFFRDINDEQRLKLLGLFGVPVNDIGKHHGRQLMALYRIKSEIAEVLLEDQSVDE
jgi:hypothetical protein